MNKQHLISKAQLQISQLLLTIQAEKEVGEWDEKNPWVERDEDGQFSENGGGSTPSESKSDKSSGSDSDEESSNGATSEKIQSTIQQAQKELNKIKNVVASTSEETISKAKKLLDSPEIQKIHSETKAKLDKISKEYGKLYEESITKVKEYNPKATIKAIERGLNKMQGKATVEPDDLRKVYDAMDVLALAFEVNSSVDLAVVIATLPVTGTLALPALAWQGTWLFVEHYFNEEGLKDGEKKVEEGTVAKSFYKNDDEKIKNAIKVLGDGGKAIANIIEKNKGKKWDYSSIAPIME
jgi:hypothetical protein